MSTLLRTAPTRYTKTVIASSPASAPTYHPSEHTVVEHSHGHLAPHDKCRTPKTSESMKMALNTRMSGFYPTLKSSKGMSHGHQIRFVHTDIQFPDMEKYRRDSTKDVTQPNRDTADQRRAFTYLSYGVGSMLGLYLGKGMVRGLVAYKSMSADKLAMAAIECDISVIPEGVTKTFEWRGKPVFVRHRTQEEIERERAVPMSELRHPQKDEERALITPEWVVTMGICTHLGCVPISNKGDYGGYYCPCHGSHYDTAGRIRKGPAPENLEIPPHEMVKEGVLKVGKE